MSSTIERRAESAARRAFLLAAALLLCAAPVFAEALSVRAAGGVFAQEENEFVLAVPGVLPEDVRVDPPELPDGVRLVSYRRYEVADGEGVRGTEIRFWLSFAEAGEFSGATALPPLSAEIGGRAVSVAFGPFTVNENPSRVQPVLLAEVGSRSVVVQAGDTVRLSVFVRYAAQVLRLSFRLPPDSIFSEVSRSVNSEGRSEFSAESVLLAEFDWTPLVPGEIPFPEVSVDAITYGGERRTVSLPARTLSVMPPLAPGIAVRAEPGREFSDGFGAAFEPAEESADVGGAGVSRGVAERLAELRSEERRSPFGGAAREERRRIEVEAGISPVDEPCVPPFRLIAGAGGLLVAAGAVAAARRRRGIAAAAFVLSSAAWAFSAWAFVRSRGESGVFAGGRLASVPEQSGERTGASVPAGTRVSVVARAGGWLCVECASGGGWTQADAVIPIR